MAKKSKYQPLELDLFQVLEQYPKEIVKNKRQRANIDKLDATKHVLICNVKKDNVDKFIDGSATIYYTGKKFPSTIALNKLYYFVPYIGAKCGLGYTGIRDLYLIKVARVGSRREGEIDNDPNDLRIVFEIEFVKHLYDHYEPHKPLIWETFTDTNIGKLANLGEEEKIIPNHLNCLTYVSLFSSAGVGCYGFKQNHFECVATNELLSERLDVQRANNKCRFESGYIAGDITKESTRQRLYDEIELWRNEQGLQQLDVLFATPPCQGMSTANYKKTDDEQARNSLVVQAISIIQHIQPKIFVFENVRAFMKTICTDISGEYITIEESIKRNLADKYNIEYKIINFKDYGVPSSRPRTIVIGTSKELRNVAPFNLFPIRREEITLREAIGNMPHLDFGAKDEHDFLHFARPFPEYQREWIHNLREGETAFDNPDETQPYKLDVEGNRVPLKGAYMGNKYRRLFWDRPCACIATRNDQLASQDTIHPTDDRVLSIRELMRVMTIPDSFKWTSYDSLITPENADGYLVDNELNIRRCIGEAVPTHIVSDIASNIRTMLDYELFVNDFDEERIKDYQQDERLLGNFYIDTFLKEQQIENAKDSGSFYTPQCVVYDAIKDVKISKERIRILEPSVGLGAFLPQVASKFSDKEQVDIDVVELDEHTLDNLQACLSKINIGSNVNIHFYQHDFLTIVVNGKYDLVVTNPPYGKSTIKYPNITGNSKIKNLFALFLIKLHDLADEIACIIPKNFLMADEFYSIRKLYEDNGITNISDFGVKFFKKVFVEIVAIHFSKSYTGETIINDYINGRIIMQPHRYIYHEKLWLPYRNDFFDRYIQSLELDIFDSFRDRQITTSNVKPSGKIRVLKSKNILDDGSIISVNGYDKYIDDISSFAVSKYLNSNALLMVSFTYNIRATRLPSNTIPNGSIAILRPKRELHLADEELQLYASSEFREYYAIVKSYSKFTLNIDDCACYYIGIKKG